MIDIETRQNNSTGFKKKYYNFMQRLTGKRSIKSYEVAPKGANATQTATVQSPATSIPSLSGNSMLLESMIKKQN